MRPLLQVTVQAGTAEKFSHEQQTYNSSCTNLLTYTYHLYAKARVLLLNQQQHITSAFALGH